MRLRNDLTDTRAAGERTFNLTALAERLVEEGRHLLLARLIRRARDIRSLHADLAMALESIDALDALLRSPKAPDDFHRAITESALLNNAVVLYARATKTTSEERAGYDLRHRFTEDEKIAHQELVDLRDSAIAHFGSGKSYAGLWQVDLVLLHVKPEAAKPAVATRRQTIDLKLAARARKQIEATLEMLRTESLNKLAELSAEIEKVASADDEFPNDLAKHPLNLPVFLSSDEAAAHALSGFDDQIYVKGIVSHK